jgi:hypothetical protein
VSRDLDVQYKTAVVLSHKLREAMAREHANRQLDGIIEIDGGLFLRVQQAGEPGRGPQGPPPQSQPYRQASVRRHHARA